MSAYSYRCLEVAVYIDFFFFLLLSSRKYLFFPAATPSNEDGEFCGCAKEERKVIPSKMLDSVLHWAFSNIDA